MGALDGVDRPREDHVGNLAELADPAGVDQTLVDRDAVQPCSGHAAPQALELPRASDRVDDAHILEAAEWLEERPATGADRDAETSGQAGS